MTVLPRDSERDQPIDPTAAAEHFFAGAAAGGLAHVVVSPGSRSTALAIAVTRSPELSYSIEHDERVAAFVALGYAKQSGQPVGLVCTSGTAAANYLPAIAEASMSGVPLVVITADRPPEHQNWGVGQAFDQRGLYARQVRDEITMAVGGNGGARFAVRAGWRSVVTATSEHGPVHVNWPFRLPLEPESDAIAAPDVPDRLVAAPATDHNEVDYLAELLGASDSPVIVAGPDSAMTNEHGAAIVAAAEHLGIAVIADVLSGLPHGSPCRVSCPSLAVTAASAPTADLIIRLGQTPTAKSVRLWWERQHGAHVLVDPTSLWHDPSHRSTARLTTNPALLLAAVAEQVDAAPDNADWLERWADLSTLATRSVDSVLASWPTTTEAHVARILGEAASSGDTIVASSSMPVRDIDTFAHDTTARVLSNRGINGIDGVIATASGVHLAGTGGGDTYVLVGDVATIHDIGGLLAAARKGIALRVIVPNNDGGGIFSQLPIRDALDDSLFQEIFHTPHGTTFSFLAGHPGITYVETTDVRTALLDTKNQPGVVLIEVPVDTPERLHFAAALRASMSNPES